MTPRCLMQSSNSTKNYVPKGFSNRSKPRLIFSLAKAWFCPNHIMGNGRIDSTIKPSGNRDETHMATSQCEVEFFHVRFVAVGAQNIHPKVPGVGT